MSELGDMLETSEEEKRKHFMDSFKALEAKKGEIVSCIYWEFGKQNGIRGILDDIVPFDFVNIEGNIINFVGERTAIGYVIVENEDKIAYSIFKNPEAKDYRGSFRDPMQVIEAQKKYLGLSVNEKEMQEHAEAKVAKRR